MGNDNLVQAAKVPKASPTSRSMCVVAGSHLQVTELQTVGSATFPGALYWRCCTLPRLITAEPSLSVLLDNYLQYISYLLPRYLHCAIVTCSEQAMLVL